VGSDRQTKTRIKYAVVAASLLLPGGCVYGWFYYTRHFSLPDPPFRESQRAERHPAAAIVLAAPPATATPSAPDEAHPSDSTEPRPPTFMLPADALDEFHQEVFTSLVGMFGTDFPDLRVAMEGEPSSADVKSPIFRRTTLQLLAAASAAPAERKPALLLVADIAATHLWCDASRDSSTPPKSTCPDVESDLAKYGLALHYDELGGGFYYNRELLWRVWENYADSTAGEQAFVTLLQSGWDTSATCSKGADETREVIRRGEEFLQKHSASPYRAAVTFLVAEAYSSWWSLSKMDGNSGMGDYVDAKDFQAGAEGARRKAIAYFERLTAIAPGTKFDQSARLAAASLREKEVLEVPPFFCVYD